MADNEQKKKTEEAALIKGLPIGLAVGMGSGVAIGVGTDQIAIWLPVGIALGFGLALAFGQAMIANEKKKSEQAEDDTSDQE